MPESESAFRPDNLGTNYESPKGRDVTIRIFSFRHAMKDKSKQASPYGLAESAALGEQLPDVAKDGYKLIPSTQERSLRTIEKMTEKYSGARRFNTREKGFVSLYDCRLPYDSDGFEAAWGQKIEEARDEIFAREGLDENAYQQLRPEQQALVDDLLESAAVVDWIDNPSSEMAKSLPPETMAMSTAIELDRYLRMPERLKSGSAVDLLRGTHQSILEPLLARVVRLPNGEPVKSLNDIGGAMGFNEGFELISQTDKTGQPSARLILYRAPRDWRNPTPPQYQKTEYGLDLDELHRLAVSGRQLLKESPENASGPPV